jgi:hypothetical protein
MTWVRFGGRDHTKKLMNQNRCHQDIRKFTCNEDSRRSADTVTSQLGVTVLTNLGASIMRSRILAPFFCILFCAAVFGLPRFEPVRETIRPSAKPTPSPGSLETVKEYLLNSAAKDFHDHQPPSPLRFRKVRIGHVGDRSKSGSYRMCGEFLAAEGSGKPKWVPFVTIKTSGYEQHLGRTHYCSDKAVVWDTKGDLASILMSKWDALK